MDFAQGDLAYYLADPSQVEAVASARNATVVRASLVANPHIDGLRAMVDVLIKPGMTSDIRIFLRAGARSLTETWTFPCSAPAAAISGAPQPALQNVVHETRIGVTIGESTQLPVKN